MRGFEIQEYELAENPSSRCPCLLALDVSGSMTGAPIDELNEGVQLFYKEIRNDEKARNSVEVGIVTFSSGASLITQISSTSGPVPPTLHAGGSTCLGEGVDLALNILEERKNLYQRMGVSYWQPWMVLMTDGQPTDEWRGAAQKIHELTEQRKLSFFGIGVGMQADMETLRMICPPSRPPVRLKGIQFCEFFEWLSKSMERVSSSVPGSSIRLPEIDGWAEIPA